MANPWTKVSSAATIRLNKLPDHWRSSILFIFSVPILHWPLSWHDHHTKFQKGLCHIIELFLRFVFSIAGHLPVCFFHFLNEFRSRPWVVFICLAYISNATCKLWFFQDNIFRKTMNGLDRLFLFSKEFSNCSAEFSPYFTFSFRLCCLIDDGSKTTYLIKIKLSIYT